MSQFFVAGLRVYPRRIPANVHERSLDAKDMGVYLLANLDGQHLEK
jgi:hypothetical protein